MIKCMTFSRDHCCPSGIMVEDDGFYTLFPERWEEDFQLGLNNELSNRKKYFQMDINKIKDKAKLISDSRDFINSEIEKLKKTVI